MYNVTSMGDADGNGWWAQFATDVMVKADGSAPGKVVSIKIPRTEELGLEPVQRRRSEASSR